ncbi:hypothetical protein BDR26DRAFT_1002971 [Obelidium mucronatum]|nr:hypothetical protein BDR26DRAFT_1002971 [Obelidium mucronatum]
MKKLLEKARTQTGIEGIEIVGIGAQASTDNSITIRDSAGQLTAAVVLRLSPRTKLKDSSIEAEFCGICELDTGETVFHREVLTVAEYEDWLATAENNGLIAVPLIFQLPQNKQLPPSAKSHAGSIRYSIKCTISCLENFKLFRSNYEVETPVIVHVSDHIKTRMELNVSGRDPLFILIEESLVISACDATDSTSTSSPIPHDSEREEIDNLISTYSTPLRSWSVSMVADWVKQFGVSSASVISFIEQEIDGTALLTLSGEDLRDELGVSALGTRRRLAVAIESLRTAHCQ